mmetsp:Transcript_72730/g.151861  ORF Transcript_72730/g.151861 Transcript_72730/m.151861 type:complete len:302 (-) Transcript_72730:464-1369(-)
MAAHVQYLGLTPEEAEMGLMDSEVHDVVQTSTTWRVPKVAAAVTVSAAVVAVGCFSLRNSSAAAPAPLRAGSSFVGLNDADVDDLFAAGNAQQEAIMAKLGDKMDLDKMKKLIEELAGPQAIKGDLPDLEDTDDEVNANIKKLLHIVEQRKEANGIPASTPIFAMPFKTEEPAKPVPQTPIANRFLEQPVEGDDVIAAAQKQQQEIMAQFGPNGLDEEKMKSLVEQIAGSQAMSGPLPTMKGKGPALSAKAQEDVNHLLSIIDDKQKELKQKGVPQVPQGIPVFNLPRGHNIPGDEVPFPP